MPGTNNGTPGLVGPLRPLPTPPASANSSTGSPNNKSKAARALKPGDEMFAPFNIAFNTSMRYFEWLEKEENAFRLKRFGKAMTGTEKWEVPGSIIGGMCLFRFRGVLVCATNKD